MGLTKLAIERPIFILMIVLFFVFGGCSAYQSLRKEENPEVTFGTVTISTVYPGAGPEEINTLISRKVEEAVSGLNGQTELTSVSQEGISTVTVNFDVGTNMDVALNDIRQKVEGISGNLPLAAQKPIVQKFDFNASPVYTLAVTSDRLNPQALRELMDKKVKDRFAQITGVSAVSVIGGDVREIQIQIQRDKLAAFGVGIADIQRALSAATLNVPSGRITAGGTETSVRVLGEFKRVDEIGNMLISISDPNNPGAKSTNVRLKDIAEVKDTVAERRIYSRLNGKDSLTLSILKAREGNAIEIAKQAKVIEEAVTKETKDTSHLTFEKTFESGERISDSLDDLNLTLYIGIMLVALIVYLFLHNFRGMLIVAIAIPICLLATILAYKILGFTINNLSMLALSLAIGVLVDDAIVVLENIYRHLKMGEEPVQAAINGRSEIGLAAIAITLADVVVFLPVGTMGGIVGQFFKPLGIGFVVAVLMSLFVSFTVTPLLAARMYRPGEDAEALGGRFAQAFERFFGRVEHGYRRALEWALHHRWFVFCAGWVILVSVFMGLGGSFAPKISGAIFTGFIPFLLAVGIGLLAFIVNLIFYRRVKPMILIGAILFGLCFPIAGAIGFGYAQWKKDTLFKFQFMPITDGGQVTINVQLPPGSSLKATEDVVKGLEKIVLADEDSKYCISTIGSKGGGGFSASERGTNYAGISVTLRDKTAPLDALLHPSEAKHGRKRSDTSVAADLLIKIGKVAGAEVTVSTSGGQGFGSPIQMSFRSDDRDKLFKSALAIKEKLASGAIEGVINVDISAKPGKPEIQAIPDREQLADSGVSVADLAATMRVLYEGDNTVKFRELGNEYDIRVLMADADRNNMDVVRNVPLSFKQGNPILLSSVTNVVESTVPDRVERRDRQDEVKITTDLLPGYTAGNVQTKIDAWLKDQKLLPDGVEQKALGQAEVQARESQYLFGALGTGFLLVFMLLASLYDNLLYPFIIQLAQPQAMTGAFLALILTDKALNIVGFIGIIALVGLVGKNAILLVDYTNTLRERGMNRHDALVTAGPIRLRPIAMTTSAVILGMLPVAFAIGRGSEFRETIGIIIVGGITLSTLLTLLIIPCSYTIFDDLNNLIRGKKPEAATMKLDEVAPES